MADIRHHRITIISYRKPVKKTLNEELQYFGNSLGLFGERDKDRSCFRVFIELLKSTRRNIGLSSDDIAVRTGLSRGTVIHHIHKLVDSGLVVEDRGRYFLRAGNLETVMDEIKKDVNRTMDDLRKIAKEIDDEIGL